MKLNDENLKLKMFIISRCYLPLVDVNLIQSYGFFDMLNTILYGRRVVYNKKITKFNIINCFEYGKGNLIVCKSLDDAYKIVSLLLKGHNTATDYIQSGIKIFSSIVIFEIDVIINKNEFNKITIDDLIDYTDTSNIPLYYSTINYINRNELEKYKNIDISWVKSFKMSYVKRAYYIGSDFKKYSVKF